MAGDDLWESFSRRTVFGFHGNTGSRIADAEEYGFHRDGLPGDWLGSGWYFWQDAPARAWQWADHVVALELRRNPDGPQAEPMVLIAELEYTEGWVDLIDVGTWFAILERAARILEGLDLLPDQASDLASSVLHERDYTVIELTLDILRREGVTADAVRCAFIEGIPVTEDSAIYDKTHVQIAVRNPAIILNHSRMDRRNLDIRR